MACFTTSRNRNVVKQAISDQDFSQGALFFSYVTRLSTLKTKFINKIIPLLTNIVTVVQEIKKEQKTQGMLNSLVHIGDNIILFILQKNGVL